MIFTALLVLSQTPPPNLDQKVSIDVRGGSGKDLALELTSKSGIRFETTDQATFDRYVVHVENQPLREVMSRIADAERGDWLRYKEGYELRRSQVKVNETLTAHRASQIQQFKLVLDEYRKQLGEKPDFGDEAAHDLAHAWRKLGPQPTGNSYVSSDYWETQNKLQSGMPLGRALMKMLLAFTPDELADLPIEKPTVFSNRPTPMQVALPDAATDVLGGLVNEQIVWEDAVDKYLPDNTYGGWAGMATKGKIRNVATVVLSLQRWDENSGVQAHLSLADKKDRIITDTYLFVQPKDSRFDAPGPGKKPEPKVKLSSLDISLASLFSFNMSPRKAESITDEVRAIVANPEKIDPLSTFTSDGLIGLAHARHESVAAVLDDRIAAALANSIDKKGMDPKVFTTLRYWGIESVVEGGGWLVLAEQRPDRADEIRCDRTALHKLLDVSRAAGRLTIDDAAAYALTSEHFQENPLLQAYLQTVGDGQAGQTLFQNDKHLLRFYGSLESGQRANTEHLSLSSLNQFQSSLLEKIVYGANSNLQMAPGEQPQLDENGEYDNFWNTLVREPTFSLGNGIPPNGFLKMTPSKDRAVLAHMHYGDWDQGVQTYDVQQLAWMMASASTQNENSPWTVVGMTPADRSQITFNFQYTDKITQYLVLQDIRSTGKEGAFVESLPDDLRKDLQAKIDDAKKQLAQNARYYINGNGQVNVGGGAPPR